MSIPPRPTHPPVDPELFPLVRLHGCISDAEYSRNGPRYCAQDRVSHTLCEVRCCRLPLTHSNSCARSGSTFTSAASAHHDNDVRVRQQQERIDALMNAASTLNDTRANQSLASWSALLPIDVYMQELSDTGETCVACVESFTGLSLGDWVRSGGCVLEERVFRDILTAVERFGEVCGRLPWHGNISADAIRQRMTVESGQAALTNRWVITDWLLCPLDESAASASRESNTSAWSAASASAVSGPSATLSFALQKAGSGSSFARISPPVKPPSLTAGCVSSSPASYSAQSTMSELEAVLRSSFAQLSVVASKDGALLSWGHISAAIDETMQRIEEQLCLRAGGNTNASAADVVCEGGAMTRRQELCARMYSSDADERSTGRVSPPNFVCQSARSSNMCNSQNSLNVFADASVAHCSNHEEEQRQRQHEQQLMSSQYALLSTMSMKEKLIYHQNLIRAEQQTLNRYRRRHAMLPPLPQHTCSPSPRDACVHDHIQSEEDDDDFDEDDYDTADAGDENGYKSNTMYHKTNHSYLENDGTGRCLSQRRSSHRARARNRVACPDAMDINAFIVPRSALAQLCQCELSHSTHAVSSNEAISRADGRIVSEGDVSARHDGTSQQRPHHPQQQLSHNVRAEVNQQPLKNTASNVLIRVADGAPPATHEDALVYGLEGDPCWLGDSEIADTTRDNSVDRSRADMCDPASTVDTSTVKNSTSEAMATSMLGDVIAGNQSTTVVSHTDVNNACLDAVPSCASNRAMLNRMDCTGIHAHNGALHTYTTHDRSSSAHTRCAEYDRRRPRRCGHFREEAMLLMPTEAVTRVTHHSLVTAKCAGQTNTPRLQLPSQSARSSGRQGAGVPQTRRATAGQRMGPRTGCAVVSTASLSHTVDVAARARSVVPPLMFSALPLQRRACSGSTLASSSRNRLCNSDACRGNSDMNKYRSVTRRIITDGSGRYTNNNTHRPNTTIHPNRTSRSSETTHGRNGMGSELARPRALTSRPAIRAPPLHTRTCSAAPHSRRCVTGVQQGTCAAASVSSRAVLAVAAQTAITSARRQGKGEGNAQTLPRSARAGMMLQTRVAPVMHQSSASAAQELWSSMTDSVPSLGRRLAGGQRNHPPARQQREVRKRGVVNSEQGECKNGVRCATARTTPRSAAASRCARPSIGRSRTVTRVTTTATARAARANVVTPNYLATPAAWTGTANTARAVPLLPSGVARARVRSRASSYASHRVHSQTKVQGATVRHETAATAVATPRDDEAIVCEKEKVSISSGEPVGQQPCSRSCSPLPKRPTDGICVAVLETSNEREGSQAAMTAYLPPHPLLQVCMPSKFVPISHEDREM